MRSNRKPGHHTSDEVGSAQPDAPSYVTAEGNQSDFSALIMVYRHDLHVHCYRMLGSLDDAEDLVQETMLRAWQHRDRFKGQASLRTWLYAIATNACLDALKKRPRRTLPAVAVPAGNPHEPLAAPATELLWLEPCPDSLLDAVGQSPEARYGLHEGVSLAFLVAIQQLPPRQRAILILCDVLEWRAREVAQLLEISVAAVSSALHRARVTLTQRYRAEAPERMHPAPTDAATQTLLQRYVQAWETDDIAGLITLLKEDARLTMPPSPSWYQGTAAIRTWLAANVFTPAAPRQWRLVPTGANGQPAVVVYRAIPARGVYEALGIQLLTVQVAAPGGPIADVTFFLVPSLVTRFGFPLELPLA